MWAIPSCQLQQHGNTCRPEDVSLILRESGKKGGWGRERERGKVRPSEKEVERTADQGCPSWSREASRLQKFWGETLRCQSLSLTPTESQKAKGWKGIACVQPAQRIKQGSECLRANQGGMWEMHLIHSLLSGSPPFSLTLELLHLHNSPQGNRQETRLKGWG